MKHRLQREYRLLYLTVLAMLGFLVFVAMGGGITGQSGPWFTQWQHHSFQMVCHQVPGRSFWVNGQPMAVCTRCFGIYTSLAAGWLFIPLAFTFIRRMDSFAKIMLAGLVAINLLDVIGNVADFWENTLATRFLMGFLLGLAVIFVLGRHFVNNQSKEKGMYYGTDRAIE